MRERKPLPRVIADAPEIEPGNLLYFDIFDELSSCRHFAGGPIPFLAVVKYAEVYDIDREQFDRILYVIREVDKWFLEFCNERDKKKSEQSRAKSKIKGKGK